MTAGDIYAASQASDDGDFSPLFAGQSLRMLDKEQGAAEIVREIASGAEAVLARLAGEAPAGVG